MHSIILCADDYGQNEEISRGILKLIELGRISAVSCLTTNKHWKTYANWLKPYLDEIDIGLHFNLTEKSNSYSLFNLIVLSHLRCLSKKKIETEFKEQLLQFQSAFNGKLPDFIDGHQHIHQLPIIDDVLMSVIKNKLLGDIYMRYVSFNKCQLNSHSFFKKMIIQLVSDWRYKEKLDQSLISHNSNFGGMYHFKKLVSYRHIFQSNLNNIGPKGLIMCHPGYQSKDRTDKLILTRSKELDYFLSENFLKDIKKAGIKIARFKAT